MGFLVVVLTITVMLAVYVRYAPLPLILDVPVVIVDTDIVGGFTAVRPITSTKDELKSQITKVALATPRTQKISDSPLIFVTRSRLIGFPDTTTFDIQNDIMIIHAHLVYGRSDMGVNKARILSWLDRLGPL